MTDILVRRGNLDKGTPGVCRQRDKLVEDTGRRCRLQPRRETCTDRAASSPRREECVLLELWSVIFCPWTRTAGYSEASPGRQATVTGSNVVVLGWDCTRAGT